MVEAAAAEGVGFGRWSRQRCVGKVKSGAARNALRLEIFDQNCPCSGRLFDRVCKCVLAGSVGNCLTHPSHGPLSCGRSSRSLQESRRFARRSYLVRGIRTLVGIENSTEFQYKTDQWPRELLAGGGTASEEPEKDRLNDQADHH
jgi:hypothetical protein